MLDTARFTELKASGGLPSPKGSALKLIQLCQRDNVSLPEIVAVLQTDPAMVGRILKLANSSVFSRPRPAAALTPDVLMSVGVQSVRQIVLAFSLIAGNREGQCPGFDYELFWSRCIATGVAAQLIGAAIRVAPPAELFTVGLLLNIGRLALASLHPQRYGDLLALSGDQFAAALAPLEEKAFGYTHPEITMAMMRDWGLPKLFADAASFHEEPGKAGLDAASRGARLTGCLHLGALLAGACFMPEDERSREIGKLHSLAGKLGIAEDSFNALGDALLREWKEWSELLLITVHDVTPFSALTRTPSAALAPPAADEAVRHATILVADDDPTVRLLLQKLLAALGHTVLVARDGREGLEQALRHQPQIVITDLIMPDTDGLQLIKGLRQGEQGRSLYIIVLTMLDDDGKLDEALDLGADDYLGKPVDARALQARLKAGLRILGERQLLRREQEELRRRLLELSISCSAQ